MWPRLVDTRHTLTVAVALISPCKHCSSIHRVDINDDDISASARFPSVTTRIAYLRNKSALITIRIISVVQSIQCIITRTSVAPNTTWNIGAFCRKTAKLLNEIEL